MLEILKEKFKLSKYEENTLKELIADVANFKKLEFVIGEMIKIKLDKASCIAYIFKQYFDKNGEAGIDKFLAHFSGEVKILLDALKTLRGTMSVSRVEEVEDLRKMFVAMSRDLRVVIIKLFSIKFDVMSLTPPLKPHELGFLNDVKILYAPLAERLGLNVLKSELEDLCLFLQEPKVYKELEANSMLKKDENLKQIELTKSKLIKILSELNIEGEVMARQKHFSSVYKKMKSRNITLAQIYDLIAMRVLVNTVEECYAVLGKIHGIYRPIPERVKDYIANQKSNGYASLHTTIIAENERPLEIQIRTYEMHRVSEYGIAAHWVYKEKRAKTNSLDVKLGWVREIMEGALNLSSDEFVETLKTNLYNGEIFVQTPKGKILELPVGSTILDFAYAVHSDLGNSCVGGRINSKIQPIITELSNGDIVEIITSANSRGPSRDWLKHVKTANARNKINTWFKKEFKEENIKKGRSILEQAFKTKGYNQKELLAPKYLDEILFKYTLGSLDELYAAVGYGSLTALQVTSTLYNYFWRDNGDKRKEIKNASSLVVKKNSDGVLVDGDTGMLVRYAGCCSPIAGDDIVGYVSRGRGVTIHCRNCSNVKYFEPERLIKAEWQGKETYFILSLKIRAENKPDIISKIVSRFMAEKIEIRMMDIRHIKEGLLINVRVVLTKKEDAEKLINVINLDKDIISVLRE